MGKSGNPKSTSFLGQFAYTLDDKNRLFLPGAYRVKNDGSFVLTEGLEGCLWLLPGHAWNRLAERLDQLVLEDQTSSRAVRRLLLASATEVTPDSHGRIVLPQYLKEYASLKSDVVIIGLVHHAEIWSADSWAAYQKNARTVFQNAAPHLAL